MKKRFLLILLLVGTGVMSCRTQFALKQNLYGQLRGADSLMDRRILKNFSKLDTSADRLMASRLKKIDSLAAQIRNNRLRADLLLYSMLADKVVLLHQDPHINYEALGPILETYSHTTAGLLDKLLR